MSMRKAVMILIAAILLCGWNVNADSMTGEETYEIVTVQDNDTLWDIAAKKVDDRMELASSMAAASTPAFPSAAP